MGRGWRRAAALGLVAVVLLAIIAVSVRPAAGDLSVDEPLQAQRAARAEKIRLAAQVTLTLGMAAVGASSGDGPGDSGAAALSAVSGRTLLIPSSGGSSPPSWTAVAALAPLAAMAALMLFLRPLPTLHLAGSLYSVATSRGPPPPLLSAFLRLVAIGLLGFALASPLLFEPLLLASTSLLLVSLAASPGPVAS